MIGMKLLACAILAVFLVLMIRGDVGLAILFTIALVPIGLAVALYLNYASVHRQVSLANAQAPPAPTETELVMVNECEETAP